MKKLHLVMPMGGAGSRFSSFGYDMPKPLIQIKGKPFFYWATKSLCKLHNVVDTTFVVLQQHIDNFDIDKQIHKYFPNANIVVLPHILNGAVLTCLAGVKNIEDNNPIVFNDCDHAFKSSQFEKFLDSNERCDAGVLTFTSNLPKFSYLMYKGNRIVGTREKQVVSNDAICGAYYFKNRELFEEYTNRYLNNCNYNEFFTSGVFNELCADGKTIKKFETDFHLSFGVPEEYDEVKNSMLFEKI